MMCEYMCVYMCICDMCTHAYVYERQKKEDRDAGTERGGEGRLFSEYLQHVVV